MEKSLELYEIQQISLEILNTIATICEENNFRYFLIYGTLLGSIRHQGFIPWDDDIDIMMPRPDYDKLLNYLDRNIYKYPHLKVFNPQTCSNYPYMITRISDDRYKIVMDNEKEYGMGIFIDIYPYDGLGNTLGEAISYGLKGDRLSSLCYQSTRKHYSVENTKSTVKKIIKFPVFLISKIIGKNYFQKRLEGLSKVKNYDNSKYVGCVVWLSGGEKDIFPQKWFNEYIMQPYDKYEFRIPKEYYKILKHIYNDYMQLPPEEDRIGHHFYKVYIKY